MHSRTTLPVLLRRAISSSELITELVVLRAKTLALLLQGCKIIVSLLQLALEAANLAGIASITKSRSCLALLGVLTLVTLDLLLKAQNVKDHGVGAVQDEREKECEAAEVHVALRVELAGLNLHALTTGDGTIYHVSTGRGEVKLSLNLRCGSTLLLSIAKLELDAIDAIYAIHEQNENEDEGDLEKHQLGTKSRRASAVAYLHAIL